MTLTSWVNPWKCEQIGFQSSTHQWFAITTSNPQGPIKSLFGCLFPQSFVGSSHQAKFNWTQWTNQLFSLNLYHFMVHTD